MKLNYNIAAVLVLALSLFGAFTAGAQDKKAERPEAKPASYQVQVQYTQEELIAKGVLVKSDKAGEAGYTVDEAKAKALPPKMQTVWVVATVADLRWVQVNGKPEDAVRMFAPDTYTSQHLGVPQ